MRWCSSSRRGVGASLNGIGAESVDEMAAMEPHVSGGAPSSDGDGDGASRTNEYPLTRGVSAPVPPAPDSEGNNRGFPAMASRTVEKLGDGGGPGSGGGGMRVLLYTTIFGGSSFSTC